MRRLLFVMMDESVQLEVGTESLYSPRAYATPQLKPHALLGSVYILPKG